LCSYPKVAPEIKSSAISKHANNLSFCAKNSRLAHHFFVYFIFFSKFSKSCAGGKKAAWRKSKSCAIEIQKKWTKTQTGG